MFLLAEKPACGHGVAGVVRVRPGVGAGGQASGRPSLIENPRNEQLNYLPQGVASGRNRKYSF